MTEPVARLPMLTRQEIQVLMDVVNVAAPPTLDGFRQECNGILAAPWPARKRWVSVPRLTFDQLDAMYQVLDDACHTVGFADRRWGVLNSLRTAAGEARDGLRPLLDRLAAEAQE